MGCRGFLAAGAATLVAAAGVAACGGSGSHVVARVGGDPITTGELDHRMSVMAAGRSPGLVERRDPGLQSQALEYLISTRWVIGAAAEWRLTPSLSDVRQRVREQQASSFPGGEAEVRSYLQASGQSTYDLEREAQVQLSSARLSSQVERTVARVTSDQALRYYRSHLRRYAVPLRRRVLMTNAKTAAVADRIKRRVITGTAFARIALPETVALPSGPGEPYVRPKLDQAIARARVGVLVGPVKGRVDYYVFEVRRVLTATHRPFAQVEESIATMLGEEARRRALAASVSSWRTSWRARTECLTGYVVQKCREYRGRRAAEDPLAFS